MRAVLMAGGSGTRLRPLTCDLPKPMVPILNRPIAEHILNLLKRHNIREVIATLHYLPDVMKNYFHDGAKWDMNITYVVEQDKPLGTAGCVKNIEDFLDSTFLVISGDSITDFDLTAAIRFHKQNNSKATLVLTRVLNPIDFGVVITDQEHRINRFLEKPSNSEIFSDTVNTGIYILEPEVLKYLPEGQESDFSKDLFPALLAKGEPMYGYIAQGYWCDVGSLESYRQAQYDCLEKKVQLDIDYPETREGIWIGENTFIDPGAKIKAPALIGDRCRIGEGVTIEGGTVIGDNTTISPYSDFKRPIIWNGVTIGEEAHLRACVVGRGSRIARRAHVLEGSVLGSLTMIGEEAQISPMVRVWPSKTVEAGAILNLNLIWGNVAQRNLFSQRGVMGVANVDITPEFAVKLGAAYGSTLPLGADIVFSRDQRNVSRMVARSLIAGLMSVGINIQNLECTAIPISRTMASRLDVVGGIHVRVHPDRPDSILIEFFNGVGINISKDMEKKIEGVYFKEDFRRVLIEQIGDMAYPAQAFDIYSNSFEKHLNIEAIRNSNSKIVIDYVYAVSGAVLPILLAKFDCDAVVLNASLKQTAVSNVMREELLIQLGQVVEALHGSMGAQVSANGEQLILVDESGFSIRGETLTAVMVSCMLKAQPRGTVVVPVHTSSAVDHIVRRHDGKIIRTKANPTALMEACQDNENVILGGSGDMGFIFPDLHPGFDAMFTIAKLVETLTVHEQSLAQVRNDIPDVYYRSHSMRCPWAVKGALMRYLVEHHPTENLELIDGVKIVTHHNDDWILILPDAGESLVHIYVNSDRKEWVDRTMKEYRQRVQNFIDLEQGVTETF